MPNVYIKTIGSNPGVSRAEFGGYILYSHPTIRLREDTIAIDQRDVKVFANEDVMASLIRLEEILRSDLIPAIISLLPKTTDYELGVITFGSGWDIVILADSDIKPNDRIVRDLANCTVVEI